MDLLQAGAETLKVLGAVFLGFVAKLLYDRRFSKRPDLRYSFETPATFGAGDRARIYQNFQVANVGTEPATDVRIAFVRQAFEASEHQVQFDGEFKDERTEEQVLFRFPTLLPEDRVLFSFVIASDKALSKNANQMLVSVRAANCLGRPQAIAGAKSAMSPETMATIVGLLSLLALLATVGVMVVQMTGINAEATISLPSGLVANRGQEIIVEAVVKNRGTSPLVGTVSIQPPWSSSPPMEYRDKYRDISLSQGTSTAIKFTVRIPDTLEAGTYTLDATLSGKVKGASIHQTTGSDIQVK